MKDKFEEAILAKLLDYGHKLPLEDYEQLAEDAARKCNTLHQQALKEEQEKAFEKGYSEGYSDASSEAIKEIHKNYRPIT